jgi:hypothetical protein
MGQLGASLESLFSGSISGYLETVNRGRKRFALLCGNSYAKASRAASARGEGGCWLCTYGELFKPPSRPLDISLSLISRGALAVL